MNVQEYLDQHGLDKDFVTKEWGWKLESYGIVMPAYDKEGKLHHTNTRMLEGEAKFVGDKGSHPSLYGINRITQKSSVVYCEGQPDCVKLWQEGIPAVTATGGVKKFDEDMAIQLKDKNVYLCLDSDGAGQKEITRYYELLKKYATSVQIMELPTGYKDVCELFLGGCDKEYFSALMSDSFKSLSAWRLSRAPEEHAIESLKDLFSANIPSEEWILDKVIPRSGFSIIAGASAVGKSFLALSLAKAVACESKWLDKYDVIQNCKVLFIDKENERSSFRKRCRGLKMQECGDSIFRIISPEIFTLESEKNQNEFSDFAKDVKAYVEHFDIQLIIFDSLVDFMNGDENSAGDTMAFFNNIKALLPGRSILFPAHYGKSSKLDNRTPLERIAGSRNLGAQITSGLAVERSPEADNEIIIQSLKARNEVNDTTKYKVLIHSRLDPEDESGRDTIVIGFELTGEVEEKVEKVTGAIDLITRLVDESGNKGITIQVAINTCIEAGISARTANMAKGQMIKSGLFETQKIEGSRQKTINRIVKMAKNYEK